MKFKILQYHMTHFSSKTEALFLCNKWSLQLLENYYCHMIMTKKSCICDSVKKKWKHTDKNQVCTFIWLEVNRYPLMDGKLYKKAVSSFSPCFISREDGLFIQRIIALFCIYKIVTSFVSDIVVLCYISKLSVYILCNTVGYSFRIYVFLWTK